ncbi:MAG: hypothetical protein WBA76_05910 [Phormidesmis sp.]
MKRLLAVLSAAALTALFLGSCATEDASIAVENSSADLPEGSDQRSASQPTDPADKASDSQDAEAKTAEADKPDTAKLDTEGVEQKNVKLLIDDQQTAGQVIVKAVSTSRDGWVSIHKSQEDGSIRLPESIGEARVDAGDNEDVVVDLWEAPAIDDKLWVLLHIDAGERGTYEFPEKDLTVKKNGETMARSFVIKKEDKKEE